MAFTNFPDADVEGNVSRNEDALRVSPRRVVCDIYPAMTMLILAIVASRS